MGIFSPSPQTPPPPPPLPPAANPPMFASSDVQAAGAKPRKAQLAYGARDVDMGKPGALPVPTDHKALLGQ